ncbi:MAG: Myo-inositol 2-dehydrogenase [Firmicutes bacterium]|nr:Myo-inositol 2-dehydrogenase [Bacillota bacterium]MDI6705307.1 Gfo/Idh/MocA family oxidoreductase [Bacillota bacterium]
MKKISVGLIGCGSIALKHIRAIANNREDLVITSLCDPCKERAQRIKEECAGLTGYGDEISIYQDYRVMVDSSKPDFVSILTESGMHYAIAADCMRAGVNVLVEKPLALSIAEVDDLISLSELNGAKLGVVHQYRFNPLIRALRDRVVKGDFGTLYYGTTSVRWRRNANYYKQAEWRGTEAKDGGVLMNQCIHNIDLLQWLLGERAIEVFSYKQNYSHPYIETEDTVLGLIRFRNGVMGAFEGTISIFPRNLENRIALFGATGSAIIGGVALDRVEAWTFEEGRDYGIEDFGKRTEHQPFPEAHMHSEVYRDYINALVKGIEPETNGEEARKSIEIITAMRWSAEKGQPQRLPMEG